LHLVEQDVVVCQDPCFKIASAFALRAEACARQVCRAEVQRSAINGDHLQMNARALPHRERASLKPLMTAEFCDKRA
jgi:hypothetical protein